MKKCSFCGLENSEEAAQCQQCQASLNPPPGAPTPPRRAASGRFLPGILSYFLVTSAVFLFNYMMGQRHGVPFPPHFMVLNTALSTDELVARLGQVGVPKDSMVALAPAPAIGAALLHHFVLFAIVLFAFWALTRFFKKIFSK